jgi:hypothetical protein
MLAASWNAVSREMIANYYQKAGFCETPEPHNKEDNALEVSPRIWEDVKETMNVTFTFKEYAQAEDNLLPCAVQELDDLCIEDKNTQTDDNEEEEEAAAYTPIPKCSEAMHCLDTCGNFLGGIPDMPESIVRRNLLEIVLKWNILLQI